MKKIIFYLSVLLLACSCVEQVDDTPKTGDIIGSVSDKSTGEPISTVITTLSPGGKKSVTGSDGSFEYKELEPGEYTIDIEKEGYKAANGKFTVIAGKQSPAHMLLERIPATITPDRDLLDFSDIEGVTVLSFSIVNTNYADLEYQIEWSCKWIKKVKPEDGILKTGKTETIIVEIDREELNGGDNETVLVIKTSNGRSEVVLKAVGIEKVLPTLNVLEATNIKSTTATLNGQIISSGTPAYTERGFVYSSTSIPTIENAIEKLTVSLTEDTNYFYELDGLTLGKKYYVRAYAINAAGIAYSSNVINFMTTSSAPELAVHEVTDINVANASVTFNGTVLSVGDPAYFERGFVYSTNSNPTINNTKVKANGTGEGMFSVNVSGLMLNQQYYIRSYAICQINDSYQEVYSKDEVSLILNSTTPEIQTLSVTGINIENGSAIFNGTILSGGEPEYSEKGFVYSKLQNPTINDSKISILGKGIGEYSANVNGLQEGYEYYTRAYVMHLENVIYGDNVKFNFVASPAIISTLEITNINIGDGIAVFNGNLISEGDLHNNQRGFVYSRYHNPTIMDDKIIAYGTGTGVFNATVRNIEEGHIYYVRAYATNDKETVYGEEIELNFIASSPIVSTLEATNINIGEGSVVFNGNLNSEGDLHNNERGFVYSRYHNPTIMDNKIVAYGTGLGQFNATAANIEEGHIYYVKAYATNDKETVYGEEKEFSFCAIAPVVETLHPINVNSTSITLYGNLISVGDPILKEKGFICSTLPNPTLDDPSIMKYPVSGTSIGNFVINVSGLSTDDMYYIRAYAVSDKKQAYGDIMSIKVEEPQYIFVGDNLLVQKNDVSTTDINWESANNICQNSSVGNFNDWRLPTIEEAAIMYQNKTNIGGFVNDKTVKEYVDG